MKQWLREPVPFVKMQKTPSLAAQRGRLRTSSLRCARSRANALRCSKTLPTFLSMARDALLRVLSPNALIFSAVCGKTRNGF